MAVTHEIIILAVLFSADEPHQAYMGSQFIHLNPLRKCLVFQCPKFGLVGINDLEFCVETLVLRVMTNLS
jgi:hypothetical protein